MWSSSPIALLAGLTLVAGCRSDAREGAPAPVRVGSSRDAGTAVAPAPPSPGERGKPPVYVGADRCGECHGEERERWHDSWHRRGLVRAGTDSVVGDFSGAHFAGSSSEAWMSRRQGRYVMTTKGPGGAVAPFPVDWVIGGKRMQDAVTIFPDGRWQVLPVYFHVTSQRWVDYTEVKQGPLDPEHPFYWTNWRRMANHECLDCHTSGLRADYDRSNGRWTTEFADPGVACESCHGPGAEHTESSDPNAIFHPGKASPELALGVCAQCHGPRKPLFPLFDADHHYRPGQVYDDHYDPIVVLIAGARSEDYFADGRPRTSSFEYQALLQSACYRRGGATCLSCHTAPHAAKGRAELRSPEPDAGCRSCHATVFARGRAHTHHAAGAAQRCTACHMPPVVSGVLDKFADHAIDVPVPDNTTDHGIPNACGVCHAKQTPQELSRKLVELWPGAEARQARRRRLAAAFDEQTARASQRPLQAVIADADEAPTLRGAAAIVFAQRFGAPATASIQPLIRSRDQLLRAKAAEALAFARSPGSADALATLRSDPSLRVRLAAAVALQTLGDARAEAMLRELATDPQTVHLLPPHLLRGSALANAGDLAGARWELEWAASLVPYYADALVQLAHVAALQGDTASARERVDQVLAADPKHAGALALKQRL